MVAAAASFSLTSGTPAPPLETLELMAGKQIEVDGRPRMLHGGQNVRLAPGEWIEVELSVAAEGVAGVELRHILRDPLRVHLDETRRLPVGHHLERSAGERPPPGLTILRDDLRPSTGP